MLRLLSKEGRILSCVIKLNALCSLLDWAWLFGETGPGSISGLEGQGSVGRWTGVRYISTILTINIETVKLFHVRTRGGLACKERPFKLFQNCILEFIVLGQAHAKRTEYKSYSWVFTFHLKRDKVEWDSIKYHLIYLSSENLNNRLTELNGRQEASESWWIDFLNISH